MKFTHYDLGHRVAGTLAVICLSGTEANVQLVDDTNFNQYRARGRYQYVGGHTRQSPVRLRVPHEGRWHVLVDLGGFAGRVGSSVEVIDP